MTNGYVMEVAIRAAVEAGTVLLSHYGKVKTTKTKESLRDVVTEVDQKSEETILSIINAATPHYGVLTEEAGYVGPKSQDFWVVDALDGTINYIHEIPLFCVSIAFVRNGKAEASAIYNPLAQDLYYGADGVGAYKNQSKMQVLPVSLSQSLTAAAFSGKAVNRNRRPIEFQVFGQVNDLSQGCLRTGSAAMNLAYVAEGKLGGCWGKANKYWDIEAGLLLARLSGASIYEMSPDGSQLVKSYVAAAPGCFDELKEQVREVVG